MWLLSIFFFIISVVISQEHKPTADEFHFISVPPDSPEPSYWIVIMCCLIKAVSRVEDSNRGM
jgi:hypothetical protein